MRYYTTHKKEEEKKEEEIGGKGSESDGKREAEMPSYVSVCAAAQKGMPEEWSQWAAALLLCSLGCYICYAPLRSAL